jgi:hypothetical protein
MLLTSIKGLKHVAHHTEMYGDEVSECVTLLFVYSLFVLLCEKC